MRNHGRVIFEDQLVTVQDRHGNAIRVHTSGDGYPATAIMIWSDEMPEPAVSMAFAATMNVMDHAHKPCSKVELWHRRLGHASHDSFQRTRPVTLSHDIPSSPTPPAGILCDVCVHSKAIARNIAFPRSVKKLLELVSMDVLGPLRGTTKFTYVLIIHDAYSSMIWARGLTSKGQASQEVAWWLSEVRADIHQEPNEVIIDQGVREVRVDQGELWSTAFRNLCSSAGVKITASPTQQHTDNAFAERAIQTILKIARSLLYDSNTDERWWPHTISQATFIHNRLAGATRGHITLFELFYGKHPELRQVRRFGCVAYVVLRGNTRSTWLNDHPMVSKHLRPCALRGTYLGFSDAPWAIKGHKVWLPNLDRIVVAKDVRVMCKRSRARN